MNDLFMDNSLVCLFVSLLVCLLVCLFICLFVCLFVFLQSFILYRNLGKFARFLNALDKMLHLSYYAQKIGK